MKKSLLTRCIIPFLLSSTSAFAYEDDATATKAIPVVRALQTGSAHPENELTITATFDDLINRQFDIRMQETIEKFQGAILDRIAPVGHVLITLNPNNPSSYGYNGSWRQMGVDSVLMGKTGTNFLSGSEVGNNLVDVPLPAHSHSGNTNTFDYGSKNTSGVSLNKRFWTNTTGDHGHGLSYAHAGVHRASKSNRHYWEGSTWSNGGQVGVNYGAVEHAGNHAHYTDVNFGTHSHTTNIGPHSHNLSINKTGVNNPKIDVSGKRVYVYMWKRIS